VPHHSILRPNAALLLTALLASTACSNHDDADGDEGGAGSGGEGSGGGFGYCGAATPALVSGSGVPKSPAIPLSERPVPESDCNAVEREFPLEPALHTESLCVEIDYSTNPPCTGTHYGTWAAYRVYDEPIPRGFWVHSLEHGAVVLGHSCADCADEITAAETLLADVGADPVCVAGMQPTRRTILTPDPRLETAWAAASWGFTLTADCFEPDVFRAFIDAHRGNGPENVCGDGLDVSRPPP
jgi:uncharacterized protein DUF3105